MDISRAAGSLDAYKHHSLLTIPLDLLVLTMGFSRPRYNQKARSHREAQEDKKKKDETLEEPAVDHEELGVSSVPKTTNNQEDEDRGSMSKKKRKRFEAYVQKKLKKERRTQLIQVGPHPLS